MLLNKSKNIQKYPVWISHIISYTTSSHVCNLYLFLTKQNSVCDSWHQSHLPRCHFGLWIPLDICWAVGKFSNASVVMRWVGVIIKMVTSEQCHPVRMMRHFSFTFQIFLEFSPVFGEDETHFDSYFSNGLKPPTRKTCEQWTKPW